MSDKNLKSANINIWKESLETSTSSFFGVMSDVIHIIILTRFLTQGELGVFFISYAFLYLFAQIPRGFGIGVRKRASEKNENHSEYLWTGFILILPVLILLYVILWFTMPILNSYSSIEISKSVLISLYLATTGFSTLEFSRYYLAGCGHPGRAEKLRTGIAKTSMPIITVIFLSITPSVEFSLYAVFVSYFVSSVIIFWVSPHSPVIPRKDTIIDIIKYSRWSVLTSILNDFYHRWDTILLGIMVGSIAVSYYDTSLRIAFLSMTFAVGISKTSNVKMSGMIELNEDIKDIFSKTIELSTFVIYPFLIIFTFNASYVLEVLYGTEYAGAHIYLVLITIIQIFQAYRMQFESVFQSSDKPHITTKTSLITVLFNVITAPILVIYFGGYGVLYSTILSEIIRIWIYEIQVKKLLGDYIIPKGSILQFITFIVLSILLLFLQTVQMSDIIYLSVSIFIATFGFYLIQYYFSNQTREIVSEFFDN